MGVTTSVTIHLGWDVPDRFRTAVADERPALAEWHEQRAEEAGDLEMMTGSERLEWRVASAKALAEERAAGRLLATQPAAVEWGARAELAERGWDHPWPEVDDKARLRGRWPGSRDVGAPKVVVVNVDAALAERVLAACWWTSVAAMTQILAWRDAHPGLEYGSAMDGYDELSAQVTTPGDIWRAAVRRYLAHHKEKISNLISR